nr:MAG TPA: hypothetical protein [Caudoviricetes sp.]
MKKTAHHSQKHGCLLTNINSTLQAMRLTSCLL